MAKNNNLILTDKKNGIEIECNRIQSKKYDFNNTKLTINGLTIYNGRLVVSKNNDVFYSAPSYKGSDGKYYSYVFIDKDDLQLINNLLEDNKDDVLEYLA